jgi:DNA-binding transcriptional regulator YiaG
MDISAFVYDMREKLELSKLVLAKYLGLREHEDLIIKDWKERKHALLINN